MLIYIAKTFLFWGGSYMDNRLRGKLAFITGATAGIGRETAKKYASMGVNLIITGRREMVLKEVKDEIESKYGVMVHTMKMDVSKENEVVEGINNLPEDMKNIDILINNAGLALGTDKAHEADYEVFNTVIDTNVKGLMYVTRTIVPLMLNHGKGHIVNIGSIAGDAAYGGGAVYCASKAAVKAFTDGLRIDLVDTPIRVTNIKPGLVETEFSVVRFRGDEEKAKNVYKGIEALTPEDVAEVVVYATNLPQNIQMAEVLLLPTHQANATTVFRK
jgi:hypothetical protein